MRFIRGSLAVELIVGPVYLAWTHGRFAFDVVVNDRRICSYYGKRQK